MKCKLCGYIFEIQETEIASNKKQKEINICAVCEKKENIIQIKRHLKGIGKAVEKLENE